MTNYNLEEFKAWLEKTDKERKQQTIELDWSYFFPNGVYSEAIVEQTKKRIAENKEERDSPYFSHSFSMLLEWKTQVDNKQLNQTQEKELKTIQKDLTTSQELISKLQQDNRDLLNDIHQYKQKITSHEQNITSLTEQAQLKQQRILALEADKAEIIKDLTKQKRKWAEHVEVAKQQINQEIQLIKEVLHD